MKGLTHNQETCVEKLYLNYLEATIYLSHIEILGCIETLKDGVRFGISVDINSEKPRKYEKTN